PEVERRDQVGHGHAVRQRARLVVHRHVHDSRRYSPGTRGTTCREHCPAAAGCVQSTPVKTPPSASPPRDGEKDREMHGYEQDFYGGSQPNAELLRARRFDEADIEHVAEEIEDMGRKDVRELNSRMQVLLAHLLKLQVQPDRGSPSWRATITAQRLEL